MGIGIAGGKGRAIAGAENLFTRIRHHTTLPSRT
jgi:hypothetical protein